MSTDLQCQNCGASLDVKGQKSSIIRCTYCGTDNVLQEKARTAVAQYTRQFAARLSKVIDESFTLDETQELVFRLAGELPGSYRLDYDDLPGHSQTAKARELVLWCQRRQLLQELVDAVLAARPTTDLS